MVVLEEDPSAPGTRPGALMPTPVIQVFGNGTTNRGGGGGGVNNNGTPAWRKWWLWYSNNKVQISIGKL